jgi:hypothetical protein
MITYRDARLVGLVAGDGAENGLSGALRLKTVLAL